MNKLIWKLLRQHISIGQLTGFFLASLFGMFIVLLSLQLYNDVAPAFTGKESFIKNNYIVATKRIGTLAGITGRSNAFTPSEIEALKQEEFTINVGGFTPSLFKVTAGVSIPQSGINLSTEMFFEAVPDEFIDVKLKKWLYDESSRTIPIIIPRSYLSLYNFGFAQSRSLPKLSDGLMSLIQLNITLRGNGMQETYKGNIVGFSNRLNTILVPQSFIDQANERFAPNRDAHPSRLIIEVKNPTDSAIESYFKAHKYETEGDNLEAGKLSYFLRLITGIILMIGLVISLLALYILMLSIYLLLQKNNTKLENLLLIGYSPAQVAFPYCLLAGVLNAVVIVIALALVLCSRNYYIELLQEVFTPVEGASWMPAAVAGILLFIAVTLLNIVAIRKKVFHILKKKK